MAILTAILNTLIVLICLFLICLILIQRGKGGGLAGAFGGVGGSSAFGTKSGDVFTRVTMIVASVWIVLSMISVLLYNQGGQSAWGNDTSAAVSKEVTPKGGKSKGKTDAATDTKPASGKSSTTDNTSASPEAIPTPNPSVPAGVPSLPSSPAPKTEK